MRPRRRPDVRKKVSFCNKDIASNKFKLDAPGLFFSNGFSNEHIDVAGVLPVSHLAVIVNEVEELRVSVKLIKWWEVPLISKEAYLKRVP